MLETGTKLLENKLGELLKRFPDALVDATEFRGDLAVVVKAGHIREVICFLKEDPNHRFDIMMDLFAMDYATFEPVQTERFAVIYLLCSLFQKGRVLLKVFLPENKREIDSINDLYAAANWFEREAWDLFGIVFTGHPNLRRILCHEDFQGHPLCKDYPSDGYQQLKKPIGSTGL